MKTSPGPWKWEHESDLVDRDGRGVITLSAVSPYDDDDMRLIAAAPEMLELLRKVDEDSMLLPVRLRYRIDALLARIDGGP